MTQDPNFDDYDRQLRHLNRRLERLEDTQITPQEFTRGIDRIYTEIEGLRQEMQEMNRKFDVIMQYITGNNP